MAENSAPDVVDQDWIEFPGGELEGKRPKARCPVCREQEARRQRNARWAAARDADGSLKTPRAPLCFQCYRMELDVTRALKSAGQLDTASAARFQGLLPFEPVNTPRLDRLRADRAAARASSQRPPDRFVDKRRRAQIEARHALQRVAAGLQERPAQAGAGSERRGGAGSEREQRFAAAVHAAELQLPESWLSFVVSR